MYLMLFISMRDAEAITQKAKLEGNLWSENMMMMMMITICWVASRCWQIDGRCCFRLVLVTNLVTLVNDVILESKIHEDETHFGDWRLKVKVKV